MVEFNHPLLQNNKDWHGYTVFTFKFNDVPIRFVSEKDAQYVLDKERSSARERLIKEIADNCNHSFSNSRCRDCRIKKKNQ